MIAAVSAGVTYPNGFRASGIAAGMKPSGRRDLALLLGDPGTTAAGTFTSNAVVAAPIVLSQKHLASGGGRGVLVNSGQANAATGSRGDADAEAAVSAAAAILGIPPNELLQCSTGVIGEPLHMDALLGGLPALAAAARVDGGADFARAIMTTDTVAKSATTDAGPYRVGGAAKGVGMISPSLATMLAFVTTDAPVSAGDLQTAASTVLAPVFNAITVDGCTSTNDTVLVFASGAASSGRIAPGGAAWNAWADAIETVGASLASQLIHDGEGVTHVMLVDIAGAASEHDARVVAKAVADSPLVKTAAFGGDPNPGRLLQAVGSSGVDVDPAAIDVAIGGVRLVHGGAIPAGYFEDDSLSSAARVAMKELEIHIEVSLGQGPGRSRALGCDLSYEYVRINGEYTT